MAHSKMLLRWKSSTEILSQPAVLQVGLKNPIYIVVIAPKELLLHGQVSIISVTFYSVNFSGQSP